MRTFLTLVPEVATALEIEKWCNLCWPALTRKIPVQNYHVTMAFLGDTQEHDLQQLSELFEGFHHQAVEIELNDVGYWSDSGILWLGCKPVSEPLESLHKKCRTAANRIGARGSAKRYQPHVTLARRVDLPPPAPLLEPAFRFTATSLELWSSVREADGARYDTLASWGLG